ncbi:hypothetical protein VTK73DRAFT_4832 [Phialemonium thermophilum]|uniref:Uncharacterized protein n=1 Tax=Phialemonium thermophilum TaxID=223376 RepID=A0ABR3V5N2_9PEZI
MAAMRRCGDAGGGCPIENQGSTVAFRSSLLPAGLGFSVCLLVRARLARGATASTERTKEKGDRRSLETVPRSSGRRSLRRRNTNACGVSQEAVLWMGMGGWLPKHNPYLLPKHSPYLLGPLQGSRRWAAAARPARQGPLCQRQTTCPASSLAKHRPRALTIS